MDYISEFARYYQLSCAADTRAPNRDARRALYAPIDQLPLNMKLHSDTGPIELRITSYGDDFVSFGELRVESSLIVSAQGIQPLAGVRSLETIDKSVLTAIKEQPPEVLLLGTGSTQHFAPISLVREFASRRIGVEAMSTPAACRTYNILLAEQRVVAAILLLD